MNTYKGGLTPEMRRSVDRAAMEDAREIEASRSPWGGVGFKLFRIACQCVGWAGAKMVGLVMVPKNKERS